MTKTELKIIKELQEKYTHVIVHSGDTSMVDGDYHFDCDSFIYTDGISMSSIIPYTMKCNNKDIEYGEIETMIRGANYLIISEFYNDEVISTLHVNMPYLSNHDNIVDLIDKIKNCSKSIKEYMNKRNPDASESVSL